MGKNAKLRRDRKEEVVQNSFRYLDFSPKKAATFRDTLADFQLTFLPTQQLKEILTLPSPFFQSFRYLFGQALVGARHWEFWDDICTHLVNITSGEKNKKALADWNLGNRQEIAANPRIHCFNLLQKIPDMPPPMRLEICRKEVLFFGLKSEKIWYQQGIPHHIGISATIAGGGILHKAGSLYLLDAGNARKRDHELWLARLRHDGIYATSQLAKIGNLRLSEIKSMRQFVSAYNGKPISGHLEIIEGKATERNEATRICKALGMTIEGEFAWIGK